MAQRSFSRRFCRGLLTVSLHQRDFGLYLNGLGTDNATIIALDTRHCMWQNGVMYNTRNLECIFTKFIEDSLKVS